MDKASLVYGWLIMVLPLVVLGAILEGAELPLLSRVILVVILVSASAMGLEIMRREIDKL